MKVKQYLYIILVRQSHLPKVRIKLLNEAICCVSLFNGSALDLATSLLKLFWVLTYSLKEITVCWISLGNGCSFTDVIVFADDLVAVITEWSTPPNPTDVEVWEVVVSAVVLDHEGAVAGALVVTKVRPKTLGVLVVVALAALVSPENNAEVVVAGVAAKPKVGWLAVVAVSAGLGAVD